MLNVLNIFLKNFSTCLKNNNTQLMFLKKMDLDSILIQFNLKLKSVSEKIYY